MIQFNEEFKKDAVISLCTRDSSAATVAEEYDVSRGCLYKWKKQLLGEKDVDSVVCSKKPDLPDDKDELQAELESLKKQVHKLKLEIDKIERAHDGTPVTSAYRMRSSPGKKKTS